MAVRLEIILFLVGTTFTTGHVLRNRIPTSWNPAPNFNVFSPKLSYMPSPPIELTEPFAGPSSSNFWPLNMNLFHNPRIMTASGGTPISTEIRQKACDEYKDSIKFSADKTMIVEHLEPTPEIAKELPVHIMLEKLPQHSPIAEIIEHKEPLVIPQAPELPPLHMPEIPATTPTEVAPLSKPEDLTIPYITEFKPIDMPKAPELSFFVMPEIPTVFEKVSYPEQPELPTTMHVKVPSYSVAASKQPDEVEIISEFRPAPDFTTLNLPEPPFISSYLPIKSPENQESEIIQSVKSEIVTPIEVTPDCGEKASDNEINPAKVIIPAAPELPLLTISRKPGPIKIVEETSETKYVESPEEAPNPLIIPQVPELPPLKISELLPIAPAASYKEEKPVQVQNYPLPNPHELSPIVVHKMGPIIIEGPTANNNEEPCKKEEEIKPEFISQALQQPAIYPMFLAKNIIIERVIPNLYLSHKPYADRTDSASASDPVFSNGNFKSVMY